MHIENLTDWDALAFIVGLIFLSWVIYKIIPGAKAPQKQDQFSLEEITRYDPEIPKYFLVAALALILGGFHTVIKSFPGIWEWLWQAGYGGHLVRDLSNSHIIIVGGGTVLLTGLTWYMLPRLTRRPLFSTILAGGSFWFTLVGVFGFYLSWVILGLVEGNMVRHGWDYLAAKNALGNWYILPTAITSGIMGIGYWTYVTNVFLTVFAARRVANKPLGYLVKFAVITATGLLIGTVQGVVQVLPDNADWIRYAGKFGEYIDPISHAHVNLVTGMTVSLVLFLVFFSPLLGGKTPTRRNANWIFWVLVPGSLAFYLTFLFLGLILGGAVNRVGGIQIHGTWLVFVGQNMHTFQAVAGAWMLAGFWLYFITLWRTYSIGSFWREFRAGSPKAFWLVSSFALVMGTFQGMLQAIPQTAAILTLPSEIPNIHAQLNMIGGVILALIGVVYALLPHLVGEKIDQKLARNSLYGIASGIGGYYLVTLVSGLIRLQGLQKGLTDAQAAAPLEWVVPAFLVLTALPMFLGYLCFGMALWKATPEYRAEWLESLIHLPDRYNSPLSGWRRKIPMRYFLGAEFVGAMAGFPGLGWLLSGQAFPGVPFAIVGPIVAWVVFPLLIDPFNGGPLVPVGPNAVLAYLLGSSMISMAGLWITVRRKKRSAARPVDQNSTAVQVKTMVHRS